MYLTYYVTLAEWKVKMDGNSCNVFMRSLKADELGIPGCCYVQCLKMFDPEVLQFLMTVADLSFVDAMCQNNRRKLLYTSTNLYSQIPKDIFFKRFYSLDWCDH